MSTFLEKSKFTVAAIIGPAAKVTRPLVTFVMNRYGNMVVGSSIVGSVAVSFTRDLPSIMSNPNVSTGFNLALELALLGWGAKTVCRVGKGLDLLNWKKNANRTQILEACQAGDIPALEAYHSIQPDWNWMGYTKKGMQNAKLASVTPLHVAAYKDQWDTFDWLIAHGAKVRVPTVAYFESLIEVMGDAKALDKKIQEYDLFNFALFHGNTKSIQTILEREKENPDWTPMTALYFLMKRAQGYPESDVVQIFEACKDNLFPIDSLQDSLNLIQTIDPDLYEYPVMQPLLKTITSYIEKKDLESSLTHATSSSSLKQKRL